jgi:homoserine O-acetyltransferase
MAGRPAQRSCGVRCRERPHGAARELHVPTTVFCSASGSDLIIDGMAHARVDGSIVMPLFRFESGGSLSDLRTAYTTHGRLNGDRSNAVLVCPGTANTRTAADGYIGPGRALDPERHFIIAVDAIGAGGSSQPADGLGGNFPRYGMRDMVAAQRTLVASLGIDRLACVFGASMGAFQALEWAIGAPDAVARAVLLVPAARAGAIFRGIVRTMLEIIALDPNWRDGDYGTRQPLAGMRAAGRAYFPWTVSDHYLESRPAEQIERELAETVERAASWDAWNLVRRYQASSGHDVAAPFGGDLAAALSRIEAEMLVLPTSSDRLLGLESARDIAKGVRHARYAEIPSERGHLGWRAVPRAPETLFVTDQVVRFLQEETR